MIENILIDGFKSLKNVSLDIRRLTVLIGLNSSGKSSVLQLLGVLKQSVVGTEDRRPRFYETNHLRTSGWLIDLGSFEDIVYQQDRQNDIEVTIKGTRYQFLTSPYSEKTEYQYSIITDSQGLNKFSCDLKSGDINLEGEHTRGLPDKEIEVLLPEHSSFRSRTRTAIGYPFEYGGTSGTVSIPESFHRRFLDVIREELKDFYLVPAIRGMSSPHYPLDAISSEDLVDGRNLSRQAQMFSSTVAYEGPAVENKINRWIKGITGVVVRGRPVPDKQASIEVSRKIRANIVNEGFGTNQLIHLFAQIAKAPPFSLIGIEEPETHLHPKAQSDLAKVLGEIAIQENKNLILTTHSEHILYRVLIEVAKGSLKPEDVAIYHFKLTDEGITVVERLPIDEEGRLAKGIPDFLETDIQEFKDFLEALKSG